MQAQTDLNGKSSPSPASTRPRLHCRAVAPWTREDIDQMVEEEELEQEQQLGEDWRSFFEDDPQGLFDYADAAQDEWNETLGDVMDMPKTEWEVGMRISCIIRDLRNRHRELGWVYYCLSRKHARMRADGIQVGQSGTQGQGCACMRD